MINNEKEIKRKRIGITGATGFVGKALVDKLLALGSEVTVFVRDKDKAYSYWGEKVKIMYFDIQNSANIQSLDRFEVDTVFHLAWYGTSGIERTNVKTQLLNVQGTCEFLSKCAENGCKRFVYSGSIMEYEVMEYLPKNGAIPSLTAIYSTAKMTADFMLKSLAGTKGIEYVNCMISNIYGESENSERFLNSTIRKMLKNETVLMTTGKQLYDFIYISDAIEEIIIAGIWGKGSNTYYIGSEEQLPLRNYIEKMKEVCLSNSEIKYGEIPYNNAYLTYQEFEKDKIFKEYDYKMQYSFTDGILRVITAYGEE